MTGAARPHPLSLAAEMIRDKKVSPQAATTEKKHIADFFRLESCFLMPENSHS
jgi:hypothetical protein